jgi:hypothetical protein
MASAIGLFLSCVLDGDIERMAHCLSLTRREHRT